MNLTTHSFFYFVVVVECDEFLLSLQSEID